VLDAVFLWMVRAGSALTVGVRRLVQRPFQSGGATHPLFIASPQRLLRACKILLFPGKLYRLWRLHFLKSYIGHRQHPDRFFYFSHESYLSKEFSLRQRLACAVSHYEHESRNCGPAYHEAVYRAPRGLTLWQRLVNGTRYTLSLRATEQYRHEGDLSILCLVDDEPVCRLSFSFVHGTLFGIDAPMTLLVTRNQTNRNAALQRFRADFKQNSPPYFCVAAVCGIAMAHGMRELCLIRDEAQVSYDPRFAQSFKNSYSGFWPSFGAKPLDSHAAFTMTVPPALNPIANVKHKSRAAARRQNWLEIMVNARQAILEDRITRLPSPIDVETSALLRTPV
jgi:uncharacterized protein VirK/YbjX